MDKQKILVIIPAYNEEGSVGHVIEKIRNSACVDIVVVNDGSMDNTSFIALGAGARVIDLPFNLGIGGAMQTGYRFARDNGYDMAVQVDGDGQHDPGCLESLINSLREGKSDMVIGSRYVAHTGYRASKSRRAGMIFFSWLIYRITGKRINDTTSGFRAVNRKVIEYFAQSYPADYPEVDVLVRLHKKSFRILEVPVRMFERQHGRSSITPFRSMYYMIKVSLALMVNSIRSGGMS